MILVNSDYRSLFTVYHHVYRLCSSSALHCTLVVIACLVNHNSSPVSIFWNVLFVIHCSFHLYQFFCYPCLSYLYSSSEQLYTMNPKSRTLDISVFLWMWTDLQNSFTWRFPRKHSMYWYSNKDFISPGTCCYTTMWKSKIQKYHLFCSMHDNTVVVLYACQTYKYMKFILSQRAANNIATNLTADVYLFHFWCKLP